MQRLRFFMDLSGNKDLLNRRLVAFFASRKATPHDTQLALQWAESICQSDKVVISGFHSPLEKEVLNYLLERHHPVIFALGRALYKKVPPHLQTAFDEGNLLFISFRGYTRHSWNSAQQRNWGAAGLADEVYFTQFDNTSSLSTLHFTLDRYSDKAVQDFYTNEQLIAITRELTDALRTNKTIDWTMKESARAGMRRIVKRLLKKYKYPPEGQEAALETIMTQCEMWSENEFK